MPAMPAARMSNMTLAMPSSISRDLRTPSPRSSATRDLKILNSSPGCEIPPPISPLLLPTSDGAISKICGSIIEPEEQRQRWACNGCKSIFARDATIYLKPNSVNAAPLKDSSSALNRRLEASSGAKEHFCKSCYTERFAIGNCFACRNPVVGSTKEDGKFVKSGIDGHIWHGRCWKCVGCNASSTEKEITLGMDGRPTCEECFDRPLPRKNVVPARPSSPFKEPGPRKVSPPTSMMSGSATRQGMGAAIAELSRKFGQPVPKMNQSSNVTPLKSPTIPQSSSFGRESPSKLTRTNSFTTGARPLTAQFSGTGFNLAAFRPTTPTAISRSDSRSRCNSPTKEMTEKPLEKDVEICAKCFRGPFDGPENAGGAAVEAKMVSLQGGTVHYHSSCFCCDVCNKTLENALRSFIRLDEGKFAHPTCAPPATVIRSSQPSSTMPGSIGMTPSSSASSSVGEQDHATYQRLPRPSTQAETKQHTLPTSYLNGGGPPKDTCGRSSSGYTPSTSSSASASNRRFQPTSGAAPPTRSTLLHSQPSSNPAMRANANLAVSSLPNRGVDAITSSNSGKFGKLGGMQICCGCNAKVSGFIEGVAGPRGQIWHKKCLVCSAKPIPNNAEVISRRFSLQPTQQQCGKQLDSSAKVTADGQLRCRSCYDREYGRHRVAV